MKIKSCKKNGDSILSAAFILTLSTMIVKVLGLVYKIPLSYLLSDEGMSYFNTAYSVYTFFYIICTAGVPKAISVLTAEHLAKGESSEADRISFAAFRVFFVFGAIAGTIFIFIAPLIARLIGSTNSALTMVLIAPSIAFVSASGALRGYFNGKMKLLPLAVAELIAGVSKLVLGLIFAHLGYSLNMQLYQISALSILGISIGAFLGFIYLYIIKCNETRKIKKRKTLDIKSDFLLAKKILKIAAPITLTSAIGSFINLVDVAVVMRMLIKGGFTEHQANIIYGNYTTLVIPMFNLVATLLAPISVVLLPHLTKLTVKRDIIEYREKISYGAFAAIFLTVPITFVFLFSANEILQIIFEDSSASMAAPLLAMISPSLILMGILLIVNTAIEGRGNFKIPLISLTLGSIAKLAISVMFISEPEINVLAAPIGTVASYLVGLLISSFYLSRKEKIRVPVFKNIIFSTFFSILSYTVANRTKLCFSENNFYLREAVFLTVFGISYLLFVIFYLLISKKEQKISNYDKKLHNELSI